MATNRISVLIDVVADRATQSLGNLRKSISDADGAANKFKAGAAGAFDSVKQNAGNMALAAGTALVAFGVKAVGAFQDTALEAGRMSQALGVPVEEMSRLIEVAGDLGIESSALEAVLGKMNQTAGKSPAAFEAIGAEIVKTESGATDVNATFLATVDALNRIVDPAKRAAAAQQIFGRSWRDSAELIGLSSKQITDAMENVSDAKVISDDEVEKAREFRAKLDELKDTSEDLTIAVGSQLVPVVADLAEGLQLVIEKGRTLGGIIPEQVTRPLGMLAGQVQRSLMPWKYYTDFAGRAAETTGTLGDVTGDYIPVAEQEAAAIEAASVAAEEHAAVIDGMTEAAKRGTQAIKDAIAAYEAAEAAQRGAQSASLAYRQQVADTAQAVYLATLQQIDAKLTDEERAQAARDAEAAVLAQADAALVLAEDTAAASGETLTANEKTAAYVAELERLAGYLSGPAKAEIDAHIARLKGIPTSIDTDVRVTRNGYSSGSSPGGGGVGANIYGATGGIVNRPTVALIGESGPEAVIPLNKSAGNGPLPAGLGGGSTTVNITVNGGDPNTIIAAIRKYVRTNGPITGIT